MSARCVITRSKRVTERPQARSGALARARTWRAKRDTSSVNTGAPGESIDRTYQRILANLEKA